MPSREDLVYVPRGVRMHRSATQADRDQNGIFLRLDSLFKQFDSTYRMSQLARRKRTRTGFLVYQVRAQNASAIEC